MNERDRIDERIRSAPPVTTEEAIKDLEKLRTLLHEIKRRPVGIGLTDDSLSVEEIREKYVRPMMEKLRQLRDHG